MPTMLLIWRHRSETLTSSLESHWTGQETRSFIAATTTNVLSCRTLQSIADQALRPQPRRLRMENLTYLWLPLDLSGPRWTFLHSWIERVIGRRNTVESGLTKWFQGLPRTMKAKSMLTPCQQQLPSFLTTRFRSATEGSALHNGALGSIRSVEAPLPYENEEQELDMPSTPDLGNSPITPKTPSSQFPPTPTTGGGEGQMTHFKGYDSKDSRNFSRTGKELDPTTLFVGGLEMYGPGAWDEAKVAKFFARFGGLEHVNVVRPGEKSQLDIHLYTRMSPHDHLFSHLTRGLCFCEVQQH